MKGKLAALLAIAAVTSTPFMSGAGPDYRDKQRQEQAKALAKKKKVREQIRARRAAKEGK